MMKCRIFLKYKKKLYFVVLEFTTTKAAAALKSFEIRENLFYALVFSKQHSNTKEIKEYSNSCNGRSNRKKWQGSNSSSSRRNSTIQYYNILKVFIALNTRQSQ